MKVDAISRSYTSGMSTSQKSEPSFMALKGVVFNSHINSPIISVLSAFKKSEPLQRFFEKHDGYVQILSGEKRSWSKSSFFKAYAKLKVYYTGLEKNLVKKISKTPLVKPRYAYQMEAPVEKFEISCEEINEYKSSSHYDNLLGFLAKKISELNDDDINKMLNKNS